MNAPSTRDPFPATMQKVAASSGIMAFVFILLSAFTSGDETPEWTDPSARWAGFVAVNRDELEMSSLMLLLSAVMLLFFAGYQRGEFARTERALRGFTRLADIAFGGAIVGAAGLAFVGVTNLALAGQVEGTAPDVIRALGQLSNVAFALAAVGFIVWLDGAFFLITRGGGLPKWLGWVAGLGAVAYFVTLFAALDVQGEGESVGFAWPIGFLCLLVFTLGSSVVYVRRAGRDDVADAESAAHGT